MASEVRHLYKILSSPPPIPIPRNLTAVDAADGFIHFSTASQVPATASRFFGADRRLWLVKVDIGKLENGSGMLKWEESRKHGVFAHLYGADVEADSVVEVKETTRQEGEDWEAVLLGLEE